MIKAEKSLKNLLKYGDTALPDRGFLPIFSMTEGF